MGERFLCERYGTEPGAVCEEQNADFGVRKRKVNSVKAVKKGGTAGQCSVPVGTDARPAVFYAVEKFYVKYESISIA